MHFPSLRGCKIVGPDGWTIPPFLSILPNFFWIQWWVKIMHPSNPIYPFSHDPNQTWVIFSWVQFLVLRTSENNVGALWFDGYKNIEVYFYSHILLYVCVYVGCSDNTQGVKKGLASCTKNERSCMYCKVQTWRLENGNLSHWISCRRCKMPMYKGKFIHFEFSYPAHWGVPKSAHHILKHMIFPA